MTSFVAFLGVSLVLIVTPGPDTAITIRNTLVGGRSAGIFTALGIGCGQIVWALAVGMGIVAVLTSSAPLFLGIKYAGAAYLVYLGFRSLAAAIWPVGSMLTVTKRSDRDSRPLGAFRQGLISNLGNPKMAVFFVSLLPQFVLSGAGLLSTSLLLGCVFAFMTTTWLAAYATLVARAGDFLRKPRVRRTLEGVTGGVLITLGLRVATDPR
jgi:threonine/homoserine/homoserine lactone efflux protein